MQTKKVEYSRHVFTVLMEFYFTPALNQENSLIALLLLMNGKRFLISLQTNTRATELLKGQAALKVTIFIYQSRILNYVLESFKILT